MIVPSKLFLHYLDRLEAILLRVQVFDPALGEHRLSPDQFPLLQQARTAIGFAMRVSCPLAGREIVRFDEGASTFDTVLAALHATRDYLAAIPDGDYAQLASRDIATTAGFAELRMEGWEYYLMYGVPNFFFHYGTVYAIARHGGVPLGKTDYDGYHVYPPGFSFRPA